jgi:4'-phosphopantetheinyl transferase EntD
MSGLRWRIRGGLREGLGFGMASAADYARVELASEEVATAGGMPPARRRDFLIGRAAAHRALAVVGVRGGAISSVARAPRFPSGFVGSLSHSQGVAVAIAGKSDRFRSVGIDLELNPLPDDAANLVLNVHEKRWFEHGRVSCAEVFSAKEAVYKAFDPLMNGAAPPLRRIELLPAVGGFRVMMPMWRSGAPGFVAVRRFEQGVVAWITLAA